MKFSGNYDNGVLLILINFVCQRAEIQFLEILDLLVVLVASSPKNGKNR